MVEYVKELNILFTKVNDDIEDFDYTNLKPKFAYFCLLYTSPSPRDVEESRMPSSA